MQFRANFRLHFSVVFISFVRARRTPGPSLPTVPQAAVRFPVFGQKSRSYARPFGPQMTGFSPGTPRRRLFLYILLAVSGYAGIHYLLFPSRKKGCPSIFSCVLSTVPSPSARMEPVRKACRSSLSEHPPAPGSPLHPAPEGTAVFLAAARMGTLRFRFRAAARG